MPHHKSCKKRVILSKKQNMQNRMARSRMATAIKKVLGASSPESANDALKKAYSVIDKNAKNGIIHQNTAANKKARISKAVLAKSA